MIAKDSFKQHHVTLHTTKKLSKQNLRTLRRSVIILSFQDPELVVTPTSQVCVIAMLFVLIMGNYKVYDTEVAFSGNVFVPGFIKFGQVVQIWMLGDT